MARFLYISDAKYLGGLALCLSFNDGTTKTIDFSSFFKKNPHPQYDKYSDPNKFKRFYLDNGNVVWGKNWDLFFPIENLHNGTL